MTDEKTANDYETTRASLELLFRVSSELASTLSLRRILRRILLLSLETIKGVSGSVIVVDESGKPSDSTIVHTHQVYEETTRQLLPTMEKGLAGWVAKELQATLIPDTSLDERWLHRPDDDPDRTGPKSAIGVPILARDQLVGVLTVVHPQPDSFNNEHLALVKAIADQAGIAVLNAQLYQESQRQARIMTALAESAAAISTALRLDEALQRILEQVSTALRVEAVSLALTDSTGEAIEFRAATGIAAQQVIGTRIKLGQGVAGWVAKEGRPVIVPTVQHVPYYYPEIDRRTGFETRSIACAPIIFQGKVIGVMEAFNPTDGAFDPEALLVLTGIGNLAGTVIHRASLFERLQAAHQRYRDLFEDSIDPIILTDLQGAVREANRQAVQVLGYEKKALLGLKINQLHSIDESILGAEFENLLPDQTVTYESALFLNEKGDLPVEVHITRLVAGGLQRIQWIFRDLTERKNLEQLREDLTSMVYHDLRAPLSNVAYSLEALKSLLPPVEDPAVMTVFSIASRAIGRIQRLTSSLLDIHSLEAGQTIVDLQSASLSTLVTEAIETVQPIAEGKNQVLAINVPDDLRPIWADQDMIRRVLINLLENAIKFSPVNGTIEIGARQDDNSVESWIQDQGPGIPFDEKERIFSKFARLQSQGTGIGLGLAFCRLTVEAHGGRIWVESEPESGSRFVFTLPVASPDDHPGVTDQAT